ncbi:hypothetical protein [Robertmurraya andreesenii]|uniref:Uncharacterized protein n=1 Tax=Anoxybacillus andreesenii TaxID=1325932 RepID=A0ABT9V6J9_9BACL|nr:hypothetical protein [Robertmurraya andreesenii]MDQ0156577.1 hypothetical protein [Robertmurraya andreesenii]
MNLKKAVLLAFSFLLLLSQAGNSIVFATNANSTKIDSTQDCGCGGDLPGNQEKILGINQVDNSLIERAKEHVRTDYFMEEHPDSNKDSYLDLLWEESILVNYENGKQSITVPYKLSEDSNLEKSILNIAYNSTEDTFGAGMIADFMRENENEVEHFSIAYSLPNGAHLFTMEIDLESGEMIVTASYDDDYYVKMADDYAFKSGNPLGYWDCVGKCLKNTWNKLPGPVRIACEGACGACLWDPTRITCAGCIVCLASYAVGCILSCA